MMKAVLPYTASWAGRAIVMPNLSPPVRTRAEAEAYGERIRQALPPGQRFQPLMTLYLTEETDPDDVRSAAEAGVIHGVKLYPANATTNSSHGVRDFRRIGPVLKALSDCGVPLLVHGEVTDPEIDVYDRETTFIARVLEPMVEEYVDLKVILEHITTGEGIRFVVDGPDRVGGTVTPHHLVLNRNHLFEGGLRPHAYCLPVPKREDHRRTLVDAVTEGHPRLFLGTDSAPHLLQEKEKDCGCAGIFCAPTALPVYARIFEEASALEHLEAFASLNGPRFYGLEPSEERIRLVKKPWTPAEHLEVEPRHAVRIFEGGETHAWTVEAG